MREGSMIYRNFTKLEERNETYPIGLVPPVSVPDISGHTAILGALDLEMILDRKAADLMKISSTKGDAV